MFISLFLQQIIELLCARHFLGTKDIAVNKMSKVYALLGVSDFPVWGDKEINKYEICQVIISGMRTNAAG